MPARFVNIDRDTPLLLPPNLRDWVRANHLCLFIVDAVEELNLHQVKVNERGTGSEQYPPRMLLSLLIYSYATGVFGSRRIEQLEMEVAQLLSKAEQADSTPLEEGLTIPDEIVRRQERKAKLAQARSEIEARAKAKAIAKEAEKKMAQGKEGPAQGKKPSGPQPQGPPSQPQPKDQYNFSDPESRIMKAGNGNHFEQAYNAQA